MAVTQEGQITLIDAAQNDKEVTANNAFERLAKQINNLVAVPMADADVNLTISQEFDSALIRATGANTAVRDLVLNAGDDRCNLWVWNDSTGGFDIQVRYAAGAAVNISPGVVQMIFADGTDVRAITPFDIRQFANKTIPVAGDRFLMQEAGGAFKSVDTPNMPGSGGGGGGITAIGLSRPDWEPIAEVAADDTSNEAKVFFDPGLFAEVEIVYSGVGAATDAQQFQMQVSTDGSTFLSSGYQWVHGLWLGNTADDLPEYSDSDSSIKISSGGAFGSATGEEIFGRVSLVGPDLATRKQMLFDTGHDQSNNRIVRISGSGSQNTDVTPIQGFRFFVVTGNLKSGKFILRGRRKKEAFSVLTNAGASRGALVSLSADEATANGVAEIIDWDVEIDDPEGMHDGVNPSRLTVPAGVSKVVLKAQAVWTSNSTNGRFMTLFKNGSNNLGGFRVQSRNAGGSTAPHILVSPELSVAPGDYFEIQVVQDGGALSFLKESWFSMEVVEPTPSGQSIALVQTTDGTLTSVLEVPLAADSAVVVTGTLTSWDATNKTIETVDLVATFKNVAGTSSLVDKHFTQHPGISAQFAITFDVDDAADVGRIRVQRTSGAGTFDHDLRYRAIPRV